MITINKNKKLFVRLFLSLSGISAVLMFLLGNQFYSKHKQLLLNEYDSLAFISLHEIGSRTDALILENISKANLVYAQMAESADKQALQLDYKKQSYTSRDVDNGAEAIFNLPALYFNYQAIDFNSEILKKSLQFPNVSAAIVQRTEQGFVSILSNFVQDDPKAAAGMYFGPHLALSQQLLKDLPFEGNMNINGKAYYVLAKPIKVSRNVQAGIITAVELYSFDNFKSVFGNQRLASAFLINNEGKNIYSPIGFAELDKSVLTESIISSSLVKGKKVLGNKDKYIVFFSTIEGIAYKQGFVVVGSKYFEGLNSFKWFLMKRALFFLLIVIGGIFLILMPVCFRLGGLNNTLKDMSKGKIIEEIEIKGNDEISNLYHSINLLNEGLKSKSNFAKELGTGNLNADFVPVGENDVLGNSLVGMRESLRNASFDAESRRLEDERRNWATTGFAKFGELLRQNNDNLEAFAYSNIFNLVKYLDANQCGFFLLNDSEDAFDLIACYAFERKKFANKTILKGEGLIGMCAQEKESIFLTEIPADYINITSGLGDGSPKCIFIVPLISNDEVYGVIELASFKVLDKHEIDFTEKIAENIASTISTIKNNLKTSTLLRESQEYTEQLAQQEEELRQNIEELRATQEEAARQAERLAAFTNSINMILIRAEFDASGNLTYANQRFLEKLQYSLSELEGQNVGKLIHSRDKSKFTELWSKLVSNKVAYEGDIKLINRLGQDLWTMSTFSCISFSDGSIEKILFLGIDITDNKKQSLDFEAQIDAINRSALKAEFYTNGKVASYNEKFGQILGYDGDDMKKQIVFNFVPTSDQKSFRKIWDSIIIGTSFEGQNKKVNKAGAEIWMQETYTAVRDMYGEISKIVFIGNDITAQKEMEEATRAQAETLILQEEELRKNIGEMKVIQDRLELKNTEIEASQVKINKILEGCEEGIITFDSLGNIEMYNKAAENTFEYSLDELKGKSVASLLPLKINSNGNELSILATIAGEEKEVPKDFKFELMANSKSGAAKSILLTLSEIKTPTGTSYTLFTQSIEVELF